MPLDVEFAKPLRFKVRASGEVTLQEIEGVIKDLLVHPGLPGSDILVDASEVEGVPSTPELRIVARGMLPVMDHGMIAVGIVTDNPFVFGVARMFAVFADAVGAKVGAFRKVDEAQQWLADRRGELSRPRTPAS